MCESSRLPDVGEVPHQPECHIFPRRQFHSRQVQPTRVQSAEKSWRSALKAARNEDHSSELHFVLDFYKDDFVHSSLRLQLELLTTSFSSCEHQPTLIEVRDYFRSLSPAQQSCMSEIFTLLKLIMVIPATNAVSEWSASAVRRMKTYLRSTVTQLHFNNLLVLHVHTERTVILQLTASLNEFVSGSKHRSSLFGTFWIIF